MIDQGIKYDLELQRITRNNVLNVVNSLSFEELTMIPKDFNNNILWNFGHLIVTQQLLVYRNSGVSCNVSDKLIQQFGKGSVPSGYDKGMLDELKRLLVDLIDQTEKDYDKGVLKDYTIYQTSYNATLSSVEDAIRFNNLHEALHYGYIMALKRAIN